MGYAVLTPDMLKYWDGLLLYPSVLKSWSSYFSLGKMPLEKRILGPQQFGTVTGLGK